jgi:perosamine synthetase
MGNDVDLPALLGGTPMRLPAPPTWPLADAEIRDVFARAEREGFWARYHADECERLQSWLREYHTLDHVLLCGSGNYAVELGLHTLNVKPGDEVILADYDYPGNFLSIHAVGATPVLVDVEPRNWNLSLDAVREAIGPKTRVILASHLHGGRVPMSALMALARERGLLVLEDAAQTTGALIDGRRAGTWGDVGVLSFGGSKLLSAGRGGALLLRNAEMAQRARNHLVRAGNVVCPLTELQAALLLPQCAKLDERNRTRWHNVQILCAGLADVPGVRPFVAASEPDRPAFYKLGLQCDELALGFSRDLLVKALRAEGYAVDEGFSAAHQARSPKRFRQGSALSESGRAHRGCAQLHHPILVEGPEAVLGFAHALRRIHRYASALQEAVHNNLKT